MNKLPALLSCRQSIIMGILNTTPDSFSDGGQYISVDHALNQAMKMLEEGAQIIDVGGESTRPGAQAVSIKDEIQRVVPVIEAIRAQSDVCISIDTSKPDVMLAAVNAGANLVNDVNALRTPNALAVCAELAVPVCLMHMQGEPRTMQKKPIYNDVVNDIKHFLERRIKCCIDSGIEHKNIMIDPGFGFGKNLQQNLQLLKGLAQFQSLNLPVLVGLSRKSMLAAILDGAPIEERLHASVAAAVLARSKGANIFRVHDVKATVDALKICDALEAV